MSQEELQIDQNNASSLSLATKLEIIGGTLALFGDAISMFAIIIALEEEATSEAQIEQNQKDQATQFQLMQQQIDDLKQEIEKITP